MDNQGEITLQEFENRLMDICSKNGWRVKLDFIGVWEITVRSKEGDFIGSTGATGLEGVLGVFDFPFDKCPWV